MLCTFARRGCNGVERVVVTSRNHGRVRRTYDFDKRFTIRIELDAVDAGDSSRRARHAANRIATLIEDLQSANLPGAPLVEIVRLEVEQLPPDPPDRREPSG
jgi:hypothetical protein